MSSPFSYELDERQIRLMLQDGEVEFDQSAWNRFEQLAESNHSSKSGSFSPKLNLSISRSVIVPLIFVVLIGGLSAILFSFVDFKKKDVSATSRVAEPEANPAPVKTAVQKTAAPAKTEIVNPPVIEPAKEQITNAVSTPSVAVPQAVVVTKKEEPKAVVKPEQSTQTESSVAKTTTVVPPAANANQSMIKKRKTKKVVSEEIPVINTSSTLLNQKNEEPELELR